jgi:hypothetical protein
MYAIRLTKTTPSCKTSQITWPGDNKATGTRLHAVLAGLRPASLILARRIAIPLLLLTAGMMVVQPCAGQGGTWEETGSLATARYYHTATLLPNGKVLVAGGFIDVIPLASAELYDPASGIWSATGSLAAARDYHTATLLPNGKVLVVGGYYYPPGALASAELYDPATGTWTATGSLATARYYYTATLLPNGKVLVAGGIDAENLALASAELYDPATGTWTATGNLGAVRFLHSATLLPNGQVLVTGGGFLDSALASAELCDPVTGTWTATGSLTTGRVYHTATLLPNGQVLVTGGINVFNGGYLGSAELYDPASGTSSATGSLATARSNHTAMLLPNGKVLVAGGLTNNGSYLMSAELYDPASGTWTQAGSLTTGRLSHTATLLPDGKVLVAGGKGNNGPLASAELYLGPPTTTSQPLNISTRANVGTGDNVLIGGIIISGSNPATVVFRALGRSLAAFGVTGVLDNPTLELHDSTGAEIAINFDWKENSAEDQMVLTDNGLAPTDDFESAIVMTLDPGAYTAIVSGENDTTGVSVVEAYNLSSDTADSKFANISTRGNVGTGENVMIGGFILGGGGGGLSEVIVRGIGPSLTDFGITDALADPFLELHDSEGTVIASNDNWMDDPNMQTVMDRGLAPSDPNESALYQVLPIGAYTAILSGVGDTTGIGLVEAYHLD